MRAIAAVGALVGLVLWTGATTAQGLDLTGVWHTQNGATFYVRQIGSEIWWYGLQPASQPRWTNVASGILIGDMIRVRWVDVPLGPARSSGTLGLRVVANNHLVVIENPNDFLPADWFR